MYSRFLDFHNYTILNIEFEPLLDLPLLLTVEKTKFR